MSNLGPSCDPSIDLELVTLIKYNLIQDIFISIVMPKNNKIIKKIICLVLLIFYLIYFPQKYLSLEDFLLHLNLYPPSYLS